MCCVTIYAKNVITSNDKKSDFRSCFTPYTLLNLFTIQAFAYDVNISIVMLSLKQYIVNFLQIAKSIVIYCGLIDKNPIGFIIESLSGH